MGALHPEAPVWTQQFVDLVSRLALCRERARMLPRQIDLLVHERIVWQRQVNSISRDRLALADPQVGRLVRLVAAFLRSQSAYVEVVDKALTTAIKADGQAAAPAMGSDASDEEAQSPVQTSLLDTRSQGSSATS